jgi:hypothetical protein
MSTSDIRQKIAVIETALKDAGPNQAINAIIDVLKEIAKTLESREKQASEASPSTPQSPPEIPEYRGRKFR